MHNPLLQSKPINNNIGYVFCIILPTLWKQRNIGQTIADIFIANLVVHYSVNCRYSNRNLIEQMIDLVQYLRRYLHAAMSAFMREPFVRAKQPESHLPHDFPVEGAPYATYCRYRAFSIHPYSASGSLMPQKDFPRLHILPQVGYEYPEST